MIAPKRLGRAVAEQVVTRVQRAWGESPFYQLRLKGPAPNRLLFQPADPCTPDRVIGEALVKGKLTVGADSVDCEGEIQRIWDLAAASSPLFAFLQDFSWLRHALLLGEAGAEAARALACGWLDRFDKWSPDAWEPYLTGERLVHLCAHGAILKNADALWRSRLLSSMARQTRHLACAGHHARTGYERLMTALSLSIVGLCLPGCDAAAERGLELLRRELRLQLRPDGGHVSRNPSRQLKTVLRLQMVLAALVARRGEAPPFLRHMVGRAAANVQFFRVGDGRLAVFRGGYEDDGRAIVAALQSIDPTAAPTGFARHTGFQRLEAGRTVVIADAAPSIGGDYDSAGSFHFSSGRSRIVVNCGAGAHLPADWGRALTQPAAHSSLSAEVAGALSTRSVVCRRAEDLSGHLIEIERDLGTDAAEPGARHVRRLYLAARGDNVRGEDILTAYSGAPGSVRVRFHLHSGVKASRARDGRSVVIALPNGEGWRFRTNVKAMDIGASVYCGGGGLPQACEQIVLGPFDFPSQDGRDRVIKWAFRRLDGLGKI